MAGRRAMLALVSIGVAAAVVPAALGVPPVLPITESFVIPAGFGCSFDVGVQQHENPGRADTDIGDGRVPLIGHTQYTMTNLETEGPSFVQRSRVRVTLTYDPQTNDEFWEVDGRFFISFFPGDQGPSGVVGGDGLLLSVTGHQEFTVDLDTGHTTSYSLEGHAIDICAQLAP